MAREARGRTRRELEERFRWSEPTARKIITALLERDLLEKLERRHNGMFAGVTYRVPRLAADKLVRSTRTTVKKPGNGMPGYGSPDHGSAGDLHTARELHDAPPAVGKPSHTLRASPARTAKSVRTGRTTGAPGKIGGFAERPDGVLPSTTAELEGDNWQAAREDLVAMDRALVLHRKLLTASGIRPYLKMLAKHGDLARQVVSGKLTGFAINGARVGQIQGWRYFDGALRDEVRRKQMEEHELRPGDVLACWRDLPPQDVPF